MTMTGDVALQSAEQVTLSGDAVSATAADVMRVGASRSVSANVGADTKIGVGGTLSAQLGEGADVVTSRAHIALGDGLEVISGDNGASMAAGGQIRCIRVWGGEHRIGYGHIKRVAARRDA